MKKKGFIVIAIVAVLILVVLAVVLGKGKDTEVSNEGPTAVPTLVPTVTPTAVPTLVPEDESTNVTENVEPTQEVAATEIPTPTKGVDEDEEIDIPFAPTSSPSDDKNDEDKPNKDDAIDFDDGQEATPNPTPSISETPTPIVEVTKVPTPKVEVTPTLVPTKKPTSTPTLAPTSTPTPTPKPIITPNVGDDKGETIKLESLGISIPKRDEFNSEGLVDSKDSTWYGDVNSTQKGNELLDTLMDVQVALRENEKMSNASQGFLFQDNVITFDWYQYNGNGDFSLVRKPSEGYYELSINVPLDYYKSYLGIDVTQANHEVLKTMLSVVLDGDDIQKTFEMLYEDIHGEVCISESSWTTIGNCKVQYDKESSARQHYVYRIKAK